jgi:hypothetical protein
MKKIFYASLLVFVFFIGVSCEKHMEHKAKHVVLNETVTTGVEYTLNLQQYGDKDDIASISKQAKNFVTSEITNTTGTFNPVYHYMTTSKIAATDQVVLTISEQGRGHDDEDDQSTVTINFTIQ